MKSSNYVQPIQMGVTITIGNFFLEKILNLYSGKDKLKIVVNNTNNIEEKLLTNELDIEIVEGNIKSPHLIVKSIQEDQIILVCGKNHKFFHQEKEITLQELQYESFIMREKGSGTRDIFVKYVEELGYTLRAGYQKFKEIILDGVKLNSEAQVAQRILWAETEYRANINVKPISQHPSPGEVYIPKSTED